MTTVHCVLSYASNSSLANMALTCRDLQRPSQQALWMCIFIYANGDIIAGGSNLVTTIMDQSKAKHHDGGLGGFIEHISIFDINEMNTSPTPLIDVSRVLPHLVNLKSIILSSAITEQMGYMVDVGNTMSRFLPNGFERLTLMMSEVGHYECVHRSTKMLMNPV